MYNNFQILIKDVLINLLVCVIYDYSSIMEGQWIVIVVNILVLYQKGVL